MSIKIDREDIGLALFCIAVTIVAMAFAQWGTV